MRPLPILVAAAVLGAGLATPVLAQVSGGAGFLLGTPSTSISIHGGLDSPMASGDLFGFVTNTLTLGKKDFRAPGVRVDAAFSVASQTDLILSLGFAGSKATSEYRNFVDNNNQPINQTTTFRRTPLTLSVKQYLTSRGRSVGNYAWIPERIAPFIGVGGGLMYYEFEQNGDFVDYKTNNVFTSTVKTNDWAPIAHLMAGADISLSPRYALTFEGRYTRANARPGMGFSGYDKIDLSGFATTLGFAVRF
jgi:hypothetical protein